MKDIGCSFFLELRLLRVASGSRISPVFVPYPIFDLFGFRQDHFLGWFGVVS